MSLYPRRDTLELASCARDFFVTLIALEGHGATSLIILWTHPSRQFFLLLASRSSPSRLVPSLADTGHCNDTCDKRKES